MHSHTFTFFLPLVAFPPPVAAAPPLGYYRRSIKLHPLVVQRQVRQLDPGHTRSNGVQAEASFVRRLGWRKHIQIARLRLVHLEPAHWRGPIAPPDFANVDSSDFANYLRQLGVSK